MKTVNTMIQNKRVRGHINPTIIPLVVSQLCCSWHMIIAIGPRSICPNCPTRSFISSYY